MKQSSNHKGGEKAKKKGIENNYTNSQKTIKKMAASTYLSMKRHRIAQWIKNKTHQYTVFKRLPSDVRTHTDWKWKDEIWFSMQIEVERAVVAILILDNIDFKTKTTIKDKEGHYIWYMGHYSKEIYNICKNICTQHRSTKINKGNTNLPNGRNWWQCNNSRVL